MPPVAGHSIQEAALKPPRWRTARTVGALVLREMVTTYGRSPGGYIWALLQPLGTILVLTIAFSFLIETPALGTSFIMFYATGYLPFDLYAQLSHKIGMSLRFSRPLLAYPGVVWIDTIIARFVLNVMTQIMVFCVVIYGIIVFTGFATILSIGPVVVGLLMGASLGLGVGAMNCLLVGYFPVWERLWSIVNRPLFLASGVFFLYDDMPAAAQDILWWNPLIHVIGLVRSGFYPTYHASYVSITYGFGLSMILVALALVFLRRGYQAAIQR